MKEMQFNNDFISKALLGVLRLLVSLIFIWPFLDKVFGLGFGTQAGKAWIDGVSPTYGFLTFGTKGPFADFFQSLAGSVLVDWLFMLGLAFIGFCLFLGIFVKLASAFGSLMLLLMYLAVIPPEHNPLVDEHIIYTAVLLLLGMSESGRYFGFGRLWSYTKFVKKHPLFQ